MYDLKVTTRDDKEISLSEFKGKVLLVVNTATGCGFTPQYEALEELYKKYHDQGLEVLDFPCNQFGHQAPGTDDEIQEFCTAKYSVKFPIFKKIDVNGENASPLFTYLKNASGYKGVKGHPFKSLVMKMIGGISKSTKDKNDIRWNFTKFLVGRDGNVIDRYEPMASLKDLEKAIEKALA